MKSFIHGAATILLLIGCHNVVAAVYKCFGPNGVVEYGDKPCSNGGQKAIDADARFEEHELKTKNEVRLREASQKQAKVERENEKIKLAPLMQKRDKEARDKFLLIDIENLKNLGECQTTGCTSRQYRDLLIGRPPGMVDDVISCKTREVGHGRYRYCSVLLIDVGRIRRATLQIKTGHVENIPNGVVNENRVNEIDIY